MLKIGKPEVRRAVFFQAVKPRPAKVMRPGKTAKDRKRRERASIS